MEMWVCTKCGKLNDADVRRCYFCGTFIEHSINQMAEAQRIVKMTNRSSSAEEPSRQSDAAILSSAHGTTGKTFIESRPIFQYILIGYIVVAIFIATPVFNWGYARDNGFVKWILLGEVVATAKAIVWPYFLLTSSSGDIPRDFDGCMIKFSKNTINERSLSLIRRSCRAFSSRQESNYDRCILNNMQGINNTPTAFAVSRKCNPPAAKLDVEDPYAKYSDEGLKAIAEGR